MNKNKITARISLPEIPIGGISIILFFNIQ
jgi:hypothetical protein